jgi:hypothetical protein
MPTSPIIDLQSSQVSSDDSARFPNHRMISHKLGAMISNRHPVDRLLPQSRLQQIKQLLNLADVKCRSKASRQRLGSSILLAVSIICFARLAIAQTPSSAPSSSTPRKERSHRTAGKAQRDIGKGVGGIGSALAKGVGSVAKGAGEATADLVTFHAVTAVTDFATGAAIGGKNLGMGTLKGTLRIFKGGSEAIGRLF